MRVRTVEACGAELRKDRWWRPRAYMAKHNKQQQTRQEDNLDGGWLMKTTGGKTMLCNAYHARPSHSETPQSYQHPHFDTHQSGKRTQYRRQ